MVIVNVYIKFACHHKFIKDLDKYTYHIVNLQKTRIIILTSIPHVASYMLGNGEKRHSDCTWLYYVW